MANCFGWDTMKVIRDAFARCWDQFLDACSIPALPSDTILLDEPIGVPAYGPERGQRLPANLRNREDQVLDEIDQLVDLQLSEGLRRNGGRF